jgi:hypothetical protein
MGAWQPERLRYGKSPRHAMKSVDSNAARQRVGLTPDVRAGKDEVLERALAYLESGK